MIPPRLEAYLRRIDWRLEQLVRLMEKNVHQERKEMADLTALIDAVNAQTTVQQSAIELLNQLSEQLRAAADDPQEIQALATQIQEQSAALSAAVAANTPSQEPAPVEEGTPVEEPPVEPTEPTGTIESV